MKLFFDTEFTEFTGLHKNTTLISIGIVSEDNKTFYAEFVDYDKEQLDDWLNDNIISKLIYGGLHYPEDFNANTQSFSFSGSDDHITRFGTKNKIKEKLTGWLKQFKSVEMWSDCLAYDWVLFNDIFGTAFDIPSNILYIPFDLCTLLKTKGVDPDISRERLANIKGEDKKHNALWDAKIIKLCYERVFL